MTYENIKSIILTILVGASLLLTWNLWTYQPNYEKLEKGETVQEVSFSTKKPIKAIVKPEQILYHIGEGFYGSLEEDEIEKVLSEMGRWNLNGFERIQLGGMGVYSLVDNQDAVEILFPSAINIDLYKSVLGIKERDLPNFNFDQIIIPLNMEQGEYGVVYFASRKEEKVYRSMIQLPPIPDFKGAYVEAAKSYPKYFPYITEAGRRIYLPEAETEIYSNKYLSNPLDAGKFKNALFKDPTLVQKNYIATGEEYTDASSLMKVDTDANMISYIDPSEVGNQDIDKSDLLKRSIDFVNSHGGWTDKYRFVYLDTNQSTVHFRLYGQDGYPVFSENADPDADISKIQLVWGNTDISRYIRNNFSLGLLTYTSPSPRILESGTTALEKVRSIEKFNSNLLEDMKIGYEMTMNAQSLLIQLEPKWYYLYNGEWNPLTTSEYGGQQHGLE